MPGNLTSPEIAEIYGQRLRVRVCGLLYQGDDLLMVNHRLLSDGNFWSPPGGGIEYNESHEDSLKREFLEETGLDIRVDHFAFGCEFIHAPLHAIELFFWTQPVGGRLQTGFDPEVQIIKETRFMSVDALRALPADELHGIFRLARTRAEFQQLTGFYRI